MKRGFTLLELLVVLIIIGILATLAFTQYTKVIERVRNAEALQILGQIRERAQIHYVEYGATAGPTINNTAFDIGTSEGQIPSVCNVSNYYYYTIDGTSNPAYGITAGAVRCQSGGKNPQGAYYRILMVYNASTGYLRYGCDRSSGGFTGYIFDNPMPCS